MLGITDIYWMVLEKIDPRFADYVKKHPRFNRFLMYGGWIFFEYWFVKGPLTYFLTDWLQIWYILSAFIAGTICTIIGFFLSEYGIWKGRGKL